MSDLQDHERAELQALRQQVDEYRAREVEQLRSDLAEARQLAAENWRVAQEYKAQAQQNADTGKKIAFEYEKQLVELRTKLEVLESLDVQRQRPVRVPRA